MPEPLDQSGPRASDGADFYVGYLPVPAGLRWWLRFVVPALLWCVLAGAVLLARSQGDPGPAVWDTAAARTFTGVAVAEPYPMLYADDRGDGAPGWLLLVEMGKRGAARGGALNGHRVGATGWLLRREGRLMLELEPGERGLGPAPADGTSVPAPEPLGRVTLRGEIVDSKCYLGAMKPGHGRTHKECATLCVAGGVPPMLVTRDAAGVPTCYLLAGEGGGPVGADVLPYIADPVEVTGDLEQRGDLLILRVSDLRRL